MFQWLSDLLLRSESLMPHGQCYLWIPGLLWLHFWSDLFVGTAYLAISVLLYVLVRRIRLPFSPVFIAFGLFIGLCGLTHYMAVWTIWNPDYWAQGLLKAATALASVATAVGLFYVRPQVEEVVHAARLSEERRLKLETANIELNTLYAKLKEADQLKSQFFANVSHELRTPLALILGPAEQLLAEGGLSAAQQRQLDGISRNAKSLLKQVNDLLDIAKLEAGRAELSYAELDLARWFRLVAAQFDVAADQRQLSYRIDTPATLPAQVDPDKVERILVNLLSNAFKFTPVGGEVEASVERDGDELLIRVEDSGPGVRPELREVVFERFRQGSGGATRDHGGTGLGLAIVKDYAVLHGGRVGLGDSPLGGAAFSVRLPLRAPAGSSVGEPPASLALPTRRAVEGSLASLEAPATGGPDASATADRQVLVVEDNPEMRDFIAGTLGERYAVYTAADGRDGLAKARALKPDLIITDMMMPHLSGEDLVRTLRREPEFGPVPILLLTAWTDEALRVRVLSEGAQDYLNKPFLPQELRARVDNLITAKRVGDELRGALTSASGDLESLARELVVKNRRLQIALDAAEVAREQAQQANKAKSYFLGMVSHELRTPLSTIHMTTQLLTRTPDGIAPELLPKLQRLSGAARQLVTVVDGLLEYARVESGRLESRREPVDVVELARLTVEEHAVHLNHPVELHFAPPERSIPPVDTDPRLLKVVLSNLLGNALKFTREGRIAVRVAEGDGGITLEVSDTGLGIPADALERIFQPFEQLEPVQRKSTPGLGLGLALVKQIVDVLGGAVEVESAPGEGSAFRVRIPVAAAISVGELGAGPT